MSFDSFPNEGQNSYVLTHSGLKMAFNFAIIRSTAFIKLKFKTMPASNNDEILSLNVKKLLIFHAIWKTKQILQYRSLYYAISSCSYLKKKFT